MNAQNFNLHRQLDLSFARRGDRTILDRRIFSWPFVLTRTFQLDPELPHLQTVIVQTASGTVHGDDHLVQRLAVGEYAAARINTQGAASVHRADAGLTTNDTMVIRLAPGAHLEYLPQPRILFPGAALNQTVDIDCAPDATAIVSDAFTVHDPEQRGRLFRRLQSTMILRRDGEPISIDRMDIDRLEPGHLAGHVAFGAIVVVLPRSAKTLEVLSLDLSARLGELTGLYAAASVLPGPIGIGIRFAARELRCLRAGQELACQQFRQVLTGT